jgi:uridine kinase
MLMKDAASQASRLPIRDLVYCVTKMVTPGRTVLVGIDGGAGAGKTTFTRWFVEQLKESVAAVSVVLTDLIYRPVAERWTGPTDDMPIGYDLDWERIRDQVILPLRAGKTARFQLYDWVADCLNETVEIDVGGVAIIDGVFALRNELAAYYDLRIWFSCPAEIRVSRLLSRGDTPQAEIDYWWPIEECYHAVHKPAESAHLVVNSAADMSTEDGNSCLQVVRWSPPRVTARSPPNPDSADSSQESACEG